LFSHCNRKHQQVGAEALTVLHDRLLEVAEELEWQLQAWAVFANHYHLVAFTPRDDTFETFAKLVHGPTSIWANNRDGVVGRRIWFNYRQTLLTYERSYLARLHYVHANAVKHGLAKDPCDYPWCSARWFTMHADPAFRDTVLSFPIDRVNVPDDF
jgi:putative transposase